ncbi:hypothetical protein LCGC14_0937080 [marine sediment metagenome]|uniref:Uncharacterized protein n=1 Tax=marine sediment metagenome TaxID=412755 RepID=A0A0F9R4U6_9ZZZZ
MNFKELKKELGEYYEVTVPTLVFVIVFLYPGSLIDVQESILSLFTLIVAMILLTITFVSYIFTDEEEDN